MELLNVIKRIAVDAVQAEQPTRLFCGVVTSTDPIKVKISYNIEIPHEAIIVSEKIARRICIGDTLLLMCQEGGQDFFAIDRITYLHDEMDTYDDTYYFGIDKEEITSDRNLSRKGSHMLLNDIMSYEPNYNIKDCQFSIGTFIDDRGVLFKEYPYYIPFGRYEISEELINQLIFGDKVIA